MARRGWHRESARHSLSARGVKTGTKKAWKKATTPFKSAKEAEVTTSWKSKDFGAKLIISSKLVDEGIPHPWGEDDPEAAHMLHNKFKITVTNLDNKKKASFDWYGSYDDYLNGVTKMDEHDILWAVAMWLEDASSASTQTFEGWAGDFGYDEEDTTKAERIYKALNKDAKKIDELLGPDYGADVWGMMGQEIRAQIGE